MLKKIRCFYWSMRDRGKGRQVIMTSLVAVLVVVSLAGLTVRNVFLSRQKKTDVHTEKGAYTGAVTGAAIAGGEALSAETEETEQVHEVVHTDVPVDSRVDISGLDAFHGFMTDAAYDVMEEQIKGECQKRQCRSAKKLNYQQTAEGSFDVGSFILLSDGSIFRCDYNLKSGAVSIQQTDYSEADITAMHDAELKAGQEALGRKQAEDRKKAEAAGKKSSKKAKDKKSKKKSKKKSSARKSVNQKKAKSMGRKKSAKKR